jgi:hypothetical protein
MTVPNVTTAFLDSSYRNIYPNIWGDLAKFAKKKPEKPVPKLKTIASLRAFLTENQVIASGSGINKVQFNRAVQGKHSNYFNPTTNSWHPPTGTVSIVVFTPRGNSFVFKNGVAIPSTGFSYNYYIVDYSNGTDVFDVRMEDLPNGNFQVYADASLWAGYVYVGEG